MTKLATICSALLCAVLALSASGQREEPRARDAYNSGDYATALKEWRKMAERGYPAAQCNIGVMYARGEGVAQDASEAARWYQKAAERGHARAQYNLGCMYYDGHGVAQDYVQAHMWLSLAASRVSRDQKKFADRRDEVAGKMSPAQIAEAQALARKWKPKIKP